MSETLTPGICVIGGGTGGIAAARASAALGVATVLVERHMVGAHSGGVRSKALAAAGRRAALVREAADFGVKAPAVEVDFARVRQHLREAAAATAPNDAPERLAALGIRVIQGAAKFKDRRTVTVGDEIEIRARRFVIATGSLPAVPPIPGLDSGPYLTAEMVLDLNELPRHIVVIGGEPIGLELAQALRRLGSNVTVLTPKAPLADDDPEAAAIVLAQLEREGVAIRSGVTVTGVGHVGERVSVGIDSDGKAESVDGSHLLVAAGRRPHIDGLDLEAAHIRHDVTGILVNRELRTSNRRVFAIGDVAAGHPNSAQAAAYHASLVIQRTLLGHRVSANDTLAPRVTYTEPELAQVGLTEAQARAAGLTIRLVRWPYHDNDRAQAERAGRGHIKIVTDRKGVVLGATIVGSHAGELIGAWSPAVAHGLNLGVFADLVLPYPTLSEMGKNAAMDFAAPRLTRSWVRRIISFIRNLG
ncbi:MAG: dihydrolipoyl dehydrogenase family protein [Pseudolabrys sp.]